MADRGTYVDIIFRNGLKEFEVLPPPDVWDNIRPVLRKKQRSLNILRFAAVAAIPISISVFSFWLTTEISKNFNGPSISLNQDVIPSGSYVFKSHPVKTHVIEIPVVNPETASSPLDYGTAGSEQPNLKVPSSSLFSSLLNENKFRKDNGPFIARGDISRNSSNTRNKYLSLIPGNSLPEGTENAVNRWSVSALASPTYFSSSSFGKTGSSTDLAKNEKPAVSYAGGMAFSYKVNKRISVRSGIYYSSVGQKIAGISAYSGFRSYYDAKGSSEFSIQTSSGTIVSTNNDIFLRDNISGRVITRYTSEAFDPAKADLTYLNNSVIQNFNYLEVPVFFKFKAIDSKIDLNLIGGLSYNMLVGNSAFTYVSGVKYSIGKTDGLSTVNFSSSFGVGFEYNFSGKVSLNLEPTLRYYLTPLGGLVGSSAHPYSFGVFSGLSYKF